MISRRNFILVSSAATALVATTPLAFGSPQTTSRTGRFSYADFARQINTMFHAQFPSGEEVKLRLVKAQLVPRRLPISFGAPFDANYERFSLIFRGPEFRPLGAAIHAFRHEQLGRLEMYLGEIGARDGAGLRYEAVFNQAIT